MVLEYFRDRLGGTEGGLLTSQEFGRKTDFCGNQKLKGTWQRTEFSEVFA